jgi:hypothetical protein
LEFGDSNFFQESAQLKVYHVEQVETQWRVNIEGAGPDRAVSAHNEKYEAMNVAKALAAANRPAKIVVHKRGGAVETEFTLEAEVIKAN